MRSWLSKNKFIKWAREGDINSRFLQEAANDEEQKLNRKIEKSREISYKDEEIIDKSRLIVK